MRFRWLALVITALCVLCADSSEAACTGGPITWTSSADQSSVASCISQADDGDIINVQAGSASWAFLDISNKCISLIGSGIGVTVITLSSDARTNDLSLNTKECQSGHVMEVSGFTFTDGGGSSCQALGGNCAHLGSLNISGSTGSLHIHNNRFEANRRQIMNITGYVRGVIRRNYFQITVGSTFMFQVLHNAWLNDTGACNNFTAGCGDRSWATTLTRGSSDQLYFEDNTFESTGSAWWWNHDCSDGAREVFRFNVFINTIPQQHDSARGGRSRACLNAEFYGNEFRYSNPGLFAGAWGAFGYAGGTGVMFDNIITSSNGSTVAAIGDYSNYRHVDGTYRATEWPWGAAGKRNITNITCSAGTATVTVQAPGGTELGHHLIVPIPTSAGEYELIIEGNSVGGYNGQKQITATLSITQFQFSATCGGTGTGGTYKSAWDENSADNGYLIQDQPGAGPGQMITGCPRFCGTLMTSPYTWSQQVAMPIYAWNNFKDTDTGAGTSYSAVGIISNSFSSDAVQANRDVYQDIGASCTPGGSCTSGVGRGTTLPTTCTAGSRTGQGVGFFLTNTGSWNVESSSDHASHPNTHTEGADGVLYRCSSTNTWTAEMTPTTYPYVISGGAGNIPPTVVITSPSSAGSFSTSATPLTTLAGTAGDPDGGISSVTWTCTPSCSNGIATGTTSWSVGSIAIPANDVSTITVTATDHAFALSTPATILINHVSAASGETDNFNRDDFASLGPTTRWTHIGSGANYSISSNRASGPATFDMAKWMVSPSSADQCAQLTYISGEVTPLVRMNGTGNGDLVGYGLHAGASTFLVEWISGAGFAFLGGAIEGVTWSPGDIVKVCAEGAIVRGFRCTPTCVQIGTDQEDTTLSDGEVGFTLYSGVADDFTGGNLSQFGDEDPVVTITSPTGVGTYETTAQTLTVSGTASDDGSVVSNEWSTNQQSNGLCTGTTSPSCANIPLVSNAITTITVTATDNASNTGSDTLDVLSVPTPGSPSDMFTRPDWLGPGPNWTVLTSNVPRVGNGFLLSAVDDHYYARWNGHDLDNDQCGRINVATIGAAQAVGVGVRSTDTGATRDMYRVWTTGSPSTTLIKEVDGAFEVLVTLPSTPWAPGDLLKFCVTGSSPAVLSVYRTPVGGSEVLVGSSYSDSTSPLTTGEPVVYLYGVDAALDDFVGENVTPVGDQTPPVVTILTPTSQPTLTTSQDSITVTGSCTDNVGVDSVTYSTNQGQSGTASGTTSWMISNLSITTLTPEVPIVLSVICHDTSANESDPDTLTITKTSATRRVRRRGL